MPQVSHHTPACAARPVSQDPARIRGMFAAITPSYDRLNRLLSGSLDQHWRRVTARTVLMGLAPCRRVLDLATGTGDLAKQLKNTSALLQPAAPAEIIGADFTRPMLRRAGEKFGGNGFAWVEADGMRLPFADHAFDALTVAFGLRNMQDRPTALREMARVVRPGGRVAILEFGQPRNRAFAALYDFYSFQVMPRLGHWISGSNAYRYLADSIRGFYSAAELADAMRAAGLERISIRPFMAGVVYLHLGTVRG